MRIVLRPGHGLTPPRALAYNRFNRRKVNGVSNYSRPDSSFPRWSYQRPGNKEDEYTAKFCADHLIPALSSVGHCVLPQRAMCGVTGLLDISEVTIGPSVFSQLRTIDTWTGERWKLNAAVEGVLRGQAEPEWARDMGWSHDPVIACWLENQIPRLDLFLSVHQNWYPNPAYYGPVVLYCKGSARGAVLASGVWGSITRSLGPWGADAALEWSTPARDEYIARGGRGDLKESGLYELRRTRAPAVLVELGFQSHPADRALMADPAWCGRMAQSIVDGLPAAG